MKRKYSLLFTKQAKNEITESRDFYNNCRLGLGNEFVDEVKATTLKIIENPKQFPECIPEIRRANTSRFPFSIFYYMKDFVIRVIAVFHNSREPQDWQKNPED